MSEESNSLLCKESILFENGFVEAYGPIFTVFQERNKEILEPIYKQNLAGEDPGKTVLDIYAEWLDSEVQKIKNGEKPCTKEN